VLGRATGFDLFDAYQISSGVAYVYLQEMLSVPRSHKRTGTIRSFLIEKAPRTIVL
jgi:hypothetical protein